MHRMKIINKDTILSNIGQKIKHFLPHPQVKGIHPTTVPKQSPID